MEETIGGDMGREARVVKPRKCRKCKVVLSVDAKAMTAHASEHAAKP